MPLSQLHDFHKINDPFCFQVLPDFPSPQIHAYGPGLAGGVVGHPATFTIETNGDVGKDILFTLIPKSK